MVYSWAFKENQVGKTSPTYVAYCRAFSLLDKIREVKAERKTSVEGPEKLLDIIKKSAEGCIRKVSRLHQELMKIGKDATGQGKDIDNTIRLMVFSVNRLHSFLRYVDATRLSRNPTGMIKPWELLIKKFCGDLNIIIRPQWKYNYSYYNIIRTLAGMNDILGDEETATELSDIGDYFPILSFAGLERDNVLLHIILAHEIGHLIDEKEKFSADKKHGEDILDILNKEPVLEKLKEYYTLSMDIMKQSRQKSEGPGAGVAYDLLLEHEALSQAQTELAKKIITWLEEITADIIAIRIIGPSFIFALYQTQLAQVSKTGPAGDYPPPQVRIENCINYWESLGKNDEFFKSVENEPSDHAKIRKCIKDYLADIRKQEKEASPDVSAIAKLKMKRYNLLNEILKEIVEKPLDSIKRLIERNLLPFRLDNTIFDLIELLKSRSIPVVAQQEEGHTSFAKCDIASILNAGWIFWLTHEMELARGKDEETSLQADSVDELRLLFYEPLLEISNLTLKAIELTDFTQQFADRREKAKSE